MYVYLPYSCAPIPYTRPEYLSVSILYANLPPTVAPPILSPYVVSNVGIGKFLYV